MSWSCVMLLAGWKHEIDEGHDRDASTPAVASQLQAIEEPEEDGQLRFVG